MPKLFVNYENKKYFRSYTANITGANKVFKTACTSITYENQGDDKVTLTPVQYNEETNQYEEQEGQTPLEILPGEKVSHINNSDVYENNFYWITFGPNGDKNLFVTREVHVRIYAGQTEDLPVILKSADDGNNDSGNA